jgi:hypothetical protein
MSAIALTHPSCARREPRYELRFPSLHREGRALSFPCNQAGEVDVDELSGPARNNYFYARSTIGRDFAMPRVSRARIAH